MILSVSHRRSHLFPALWAVALACVAGRAMAGGAPGVPSFSPYQPTPDDRIENRPPELWRYYMHGVVDYFAQPIDLLPLLDGKARDKWVVNDRPIDNPFFKSDAAALRVNGGQELTLPKPLPIDLDAARGKTIRVFCWTSGENIGRENSPNSYSEPPSMVLILKNRAGKTLATTTSMTGSTGTFPWHCYHKDVFVPGETASIHAKFYNRYGGPAFFSNVSWELDPPKYANNDRQDPITGSWASNPYHDQMNMQFRFIPGYNVTRYKWRFFEGPAVGMVAQSYNIATLDGLRRYFHEKVKSDNDHMNHSLMYFASRYHFGKAHDLLPQTMDEQWLAELARLVIEDQDEATGYWGTAHDPLSMGITFHFVEGLFSYYGYDRIRDSEEFRNDRRHVGVLEIPRADRIIQTTLAMQSTYTNERGEETLAGWPRIAYDYTTTPNASEQRASLAVTNNAIDLMRRCEPFVDEALRRRVYDSIRAGVHYVMTHCVQEDGVWRQEDTASAPTVNHYMPRILSASFYLERVPRPELPPPTLKVTRVADDRLSVAWLDPDGEHNSVRLFALPEGAAFDRADVSDLIGIIHRRGDKIAERDPFIVIRQMEAGAKQRWGKGWPNKVYVDEKTRKVPDDLPYTVNNEELILRGDLKNKRVYAVAATWYGEESPPTVVAVPGD